MMKITALALFIFAGTAFATESYSQVMKVTVVSDNMSTAKVISEIERQTDYLFVFNVNEVNLKRNVRVDARNKSVAEVLNKIFEGTDIYYAMEGKNIMLMSKAKENKSIEQINNRITGIVKDVSGEAVIGANITVKGNSIGTITDIDGRFTINATANAVLQVTYIGYISQEVDVKNKKDLVIILKEDTKTLDEVVIVGYGSQKKANLTGAVASIKMDEVLNERPLVDIQTALQGAIPGLVITGGSTPGVSKSFNIRGTTSINGGEPLVLVDNVPAQIDMINPEDIENVTVLKDASSSAIYGARAAFGVILITTKKGVKNSKLQIDYNNNFGFQKSVNLPHQADAIDIMKAYLNAGFTGGTWFAQGQDLERWIGYMEDYRKDPAKFDVTDNGIYIPKEDNPTGIRYYLHQNNLYKNMMSDYGFQQSHNVSARGGSEKINYRMSLGYNDNNGILVGNKDTYNRITVSSYVSADITKWLKQSLDIRYANSHISMPNASGVWGTMPDLNPEGEMESADGNRLPINTPLNLLKYSATTNTTNENPRIFSQTTITPFKGFEAIFEYTFDQNVYDQKKYDKPIKTTSVQLEEKINPTTALYTDTKRSTSYNALNLYGSYSWNFKKEHNFKIMAGYSQEWRNYEQLVVDKKEMINEDMPSFSGGYGETTAKDSFSEYAIRSGFFRLNYNYLNKYLVEANGRYDGSSKFPKDTRFGFFPSFSLGWQVAEEKFMEWSRGYLDALKLRGSWGEIGNQAITEYGFIPSMGSVLADWIDPETGLRPTTLNSPELVRQNYTWETVRTLDIGVDMAFFNNRFTTTFDWYMRDTKGMLAPGMELPAIVGASAPKQNTADLRTKGWELSVNWRDHIGDWNYGIGFNLYDSRTHITKFDTNEAGVLGGQKSDGTMPNQYVGKEIGEIWGYISDGYYTVNDFVDTQTWVLKEGVTSIKGLNVKPGDVKFRNMLDAEGSVPNQIDGGNGTTTNPGDMCVIGNSTSRYQYGITGNLGWKGFSFSFLLQGTGKRDVWIDDALRWPFSGGRYGTIFENQLDYWQPVDAENGDWNAVDSNPEWYRIYNEMENSGSNKRVQTKYLLNGAYLRVKNITLSYAFPERWVSKISLSKLKMFVSCENLHTFHSLPEGYDPERLSWNYPFYRTISFGLNVTL